MKGIDIEGKIHWSSKERWGILLAGFGILAVSVWAIWWFYSTIPLRLLQFLWFIPNSIMGLTGLSCVVIAILPRRSTWLMDEFSAFWG